MQVSWHSCTCWMEFFSELLEHVLIQNSALLVTTHVRTWAFIHTSVWSRCSLGLTVSLLGVAVADRHQGHAGLPHLPSCHEAAADHGLHHADDNPADALHTCCGPQRAHFWVCCCCTLLPSTSGGYSRPGELSPHQPPLLLYNTRPAILTRAAPQSILVSVAESFGGNGNTRWLTGNRATGHSCCCG